MDTAMNTPMITTPSQQAAPSTNKHVIYLHGCCLHEYVEDGTTVHHHSEYTGKDHHGRWVLLLIHPRWCPPCITHRSAAIASTYIPRIAHLKTLDVSEREIGIKVAYAEGGCVGRIAAQSSSIVHLIVDVEEVLEERDGVEEEVDEMMEDLADMTLVATTVEEFETPDDLAAVLEKTLVSDELDDDFAAYFEEERVRGKGYEEALKMQLMLEVCSLI